MPTFAGFTMSVPKELAICSLCAQKLKKGVKNGHFWSFLTKFCSVEPKLVKMGRIYGFFGRNCVKSHSAAGFSGKIGFKYLFWLWNQKHSKTCKVDYQCDILILITNKNGNITAEGHEDFLMPCQKAALAAGNAQWFKRVVQGAIFKFRAIGSMKLSCWTRFEKLMKNGTRIIGTIFLFFAKIWFF